MKVSKQHLSRRLPKLLRILQARPKLIISILLGLGIAAALPAEWRLVTRALIGWDVGALLYLTIVYWTLARSATAHIRQHAAREDEGRGIILMLTVTAALASLVAIIVLLGGTSKESGDPGPLLLAVATIFTSWTLIHSIFAVHYAYEFYEEGPSEGGLKFPGGEKPGYWDFVYFSFVIGTTFQVSDVEVSSRKIRPTVAAHGILSFLFNVALIALVVNIAASAL